MDKVNLAAKLDLFEDLWSPKVVGELNGQHVRLAKVKGSFDWHYHDDADELFLVLKGTLRIDFTDRAITLGQGEFLIVPRGTQHRPVADEETHILLLEPAATRNTGNVRSDRTVESPDWI